MGTIIAARTMSNTIRLAVAHFPGVMGKPRDNLAFIDRLCAKAAKENVQFILFPEDCLTGYPGIRNGAFDVALRADGTEVDQLEKIARRHKLTIAAGMIERADDLYHSTHVIAQPDGRRMLVRKRSGDARDQLIGLSPAETENDDFDIAGHRAALAICMDGTDAFFSGVKSRGVRIVFHPSGGACAKSAHAAEADADTINAAEIENCRRCLQGGCEKAAKLGVVHCVANTIGFDGQRGYPGNSWIISPAGQVLVYLPATAIIEEMREAVGVAAVTL